MRSGVEKLVGITVAEGMLVAVLVIVSAGMIVLVLVGTLVRVAVIGGGTNSSVGVSLGVTLTVTSRVKDRVG